MIEKSKHIALFDPYTGGHHPEYFVHLIQGWLEKGSMERLDAVTPLVNIEQHPLLQAWYENPPRNLTFVLLPKLKEKSLTKQSFEQGEHLKTYINQHRPDEVVLLYFDLFQLPLARRLRFNFGVHISGIYFRPTWHYSQFSANRNASPLHWKDKIRAFRQRAILKLALQNPHFRTLFCLDPFVVPILAPKYPRTSFLALPDPIESLPIPPDLDIRAQFGIEAHRKIFLLMGYLEARKGISTLLKSLNFLDMDTAQDVTILLAGKLEKDIEDEVKKQIHASNPDVQIVLTDAFVPYSAFQGYIEQSDVVLLTYENHVGSSGLLIRAALAGKPVLSQDFGLMGALVRTHHLGQVVDSTSPQAIAEGIRAFTYTQNAPIFDPKQAAYFAESNTPKAFFNTIWNEIV
jgi:glycosyltransferase involved in cell wall biosynthesis